MQVEPANCKSAKTGRVVQKHHAGHKTPREGGSDSRTLWRELRSPELVWGFRVCPVLVPRALYKFTLPDSPKVDKANSQPLLLVIGPYKANNNIIGRTVST